MNTIRCRTLGLRVYLWLARQGCGTLLAGTFSAAALFCWWSLVPYWRAELADQQHALQRLQQSLHELGNAVPVMQRPLADERAAQFYDLLGEKRLVEQQIRTLFALAKKAGLSLHHAEYKAAADKNGNFHTYQIQLPVTGSYGAIRQFSEMILLRIPYASLDEMSFKREAVGSGKLEAKLRITLYLLDRPAAVSAPSGGTGMPL